jgi:Zn-dependent peptidase ImmA (M78 family)
MDLTWHEEGATDALDASWGGLVLWVAGACPWTREEAGQPIPIDHPWVELLEWLASSWQHLWWQEAHPLEADFAPTDLAGVLDWVAASAQESEPRDPSAQARRVAAWEFEQRHNLARALSGLYLPDVLLLRHGNLLQVHTAEGGICLPVQVAFGWLAAVGEAIAERLGGCVDRRAQVARQAWARHAQCDDAALVRLMGFAVPVQARFGGPDALLRALEIEANEPSELQAAARLMQQVTSSDDIAEVVELVRDEPPRTTPELDEVAQRLAHEHLPPVGHTPAGQGYAVARWVRQALALGDGAVDPEALLLGWHVGLLRARLRSPKLDAVACWGRRHGPVVILNEAADHLQHPYGQRSTLAHELCHLLLDRAGALPLAQVLDGSLPATYEQRANSFAAEFLIPGHVAAARVVDAEVPEAALRALCAEYQASLEIGAWQVRNAFEQSTGRRLPDEVRERLKRFVSEPYSY